MSGFFEEAAMLLHVAEKALMFPKLRPLHDAAVERLENLQASSPSSLSAQPIVEPIPTVDRRDAPETFQQKIEDGNE